MATQLGQALPGWLSAPALTALAQPSALTFSTEPASPRAGYTAEEVAQELGVSRTTAIAMLRGFHLAGGFVIDLGRFLPERVVRARKYIPRLPVSSVPDFLAHLAKPPATPAPVQRPTGRQIEQKTRLAREADQASDRQKLDKLKGKSRWQIKQEKIKREQERMKAARAST